MAPHSSTLAWKIPWTEEPGGLQSIGSLRVGHDWMTSLSFFTFMHWRRKWQPTPVFLPGESQEQGSLPSVGSHRIIHDWSDLAASSSELYILRRICFHSSSQFEDNRNAIRSHQFYYMYNFHKITNNLKFSAKFKLLTLGKYDAFCVVSASDIQNILKQPKRVSSRNCY